MQAAAANPNQYLFDVVNSLEKECRAPVPREKVAELQEQAALTRQILDESRARLGPENYQLLAQRVNNVAKSLEAPVAQAPAREVLRKRIRPSEVTQGAIQETFYNIMTSHALSEQGAGLDLREQKVKVLFAALSIVSALRESKNTPNPQEIVLLNGGILTQNNCPEPYPRLAAAMLAIKKSVNNLKGEASQLLDSNIVTPENIKDPELQRLVATIKSMAEEICKLPDFKAIIDDVALKVAEMKGAVETSRPPSPESLVGVDQQLVRDTFYDLMKTLTKTYKYISKEKLADRENWVYYALTSHTLLAAFVKSKSLMDAVWLAKDKALTLENCPADYLPLAKLLLKLKPQFPFLKPEEIEYVNYLILPADAEIAVPKDVLERKSDALDKIVSILNHVSLQVAEIPNFNRTIVEVLDECTK